VDAEAVQVIVIPAYVRLDNPVQVSDRQVSAILTRRQTAG
jgi:hypothetical protein